MFSKTKAVEIVIAFLESYPQEGSISNPNSALMFYERYKKNENNIITNISMHNTFIN